MKQEILKASDGYELSLAIYEIKNPKGIFLIMHGMEEHKERFDWTANELNKNGYNVVVSDMRGHGHNAPLQGYFADKKGYQRLINDYIEITSYIKERYNDLPMYILAHSMGSITARALLMTNSFDYKKVVLTGYPNYNGLTPIAIFLTNIILLFKGPKAHSKLLDNLSTGSFNKKIENPKTNLDWLSYNEDNVKKYIEDPLSGIPFTVSGYKDLFMLMKLMHKKASYKGINTCLPIYCLSGKDDPCTGGEKGRNSSIDKLRGQGFSMVQVKTYDKMRHEILNEKQNNLVIEDIIKFIES